MSYFLRVYYYVVHFLTARNRRGHGIHSPWLFQIVQSVILEKIPFYIFSDIEKQRAKLVRNSSVIEKTDFGTGKNKSVRIGRIAATSLCSPRKGQLLYRLINHLNLNNLLELGTSLGISTAYIASSSKNRKCITLEGCPNTANIARKTFEELNLTNIEVITGNINNTIHSACAKLSCIDFVYIDANHSYEATVTYFEQLLPFLSERAVVVFDDIYWSKQMKNAWQTIKMHPKINATFDLYQLGIVFFNPDIHSNHFKLRF